MGEMYGALAQVWTGASRNGGRDLDRIVDDVRALRG
jgi:hypothetical protein